MKPLPKVSIIIVSWNGKHWLKLCLGSLEKQRYSNIEIIVVDNNSQDDSVAFLRRNYPQVKVIVNKENLGFAEANNVGFGKVTGEYVLFLNNDTKVTPNFLKPLVEILKKNPHIGGVQSKIKLLEKPTHLDSVGAYLTLTGMIYHYGIAKKDSTKYQREIATFSAKGACMMFKKRALDGVMVNDELFDSTYFAYFEETDLCHRVWLAGYHIVMVPDSVIYHQMGGTSVAMHSAFIQYHSFKNRLNSYLKNLNLSSLLMLLPIHLVAIEVFGVVSLVLGQGAVFLAIQKAIIWNLQQLAQTWQKRQYIQARIRKVSDSSINSLIMINPNPLYYFTLFKGLQHFQDKVVPRYVNLNK